jgi:lipooligosaccharide transport system permease protein
MYAWRVVEANGRAIGRSWFTELMPSLVQPLILAAVFAGLLSSSADRLSDGTEGPTFPYAQYVVLGVVCASAVIAGAIDAVHLIFVGLKLSNKFTTVVTTPMSPLNVALGHVAWAGIYGAALSGVLLLILTPFLPDGALAFVPGAALVTGLTTAALAAVLAVFVIHSSGSPQILNVISRVIVPPLMLFSATLFPLSVVPSWAHQALSALPVANGTVATRALFAGSWPEVAAHVGIVLVWLTAGTALMAWSLDKELRA